MRRTLETEIAGRYLNPCFKRMFMVVAERRAGFARAFQKKRGGPGLETLPPRLLSGIAAAPQ